MDPDRSRDGTFPIPVSVGVFAHNEEKSILDSLDALLASRVRTFRLDEILVVSSGSTDRTDEHAADVARRRPEVRLIREAAKTGKAAAVNLFLAEARHERCVMTNADTILHEDALENLCAPLQDPQIGMAGGHAVPVAPRGGWSGFAVELFWDMHHHLCLRSPKMGELVAFRRVFGPLPAAIVGADEDWIHGEVLRHGLRAVYVPSAVVYTRGPATLRDFMAHRYRLAVQHLVLARRCGFSPVSRHRGSVLAAAGGYLGRHPLRLPQVMAVGALEGAARLGAGAAYFLAGQTCRNWRPLRSSRGITQEDVRRYLAAHP